MAFPATITPDIAWPRIQNAAVLLRQKAAQIRTASAAGNLLASAVIHDLLPVMRMARDTFAALKATPNLASYVTTVMGAGAPANLGAEFTAMEGANTDAFTWIVGALASVTIVTVSAQGEEVYASFTPAQTVGLRTQLQAIENAITV